MNERALLTERAGSAIIETREVLEPASPWVGHVGAQQARREFLESVRTRQPPACDAQAAREAMVVCQPAELSIAEARIVYCDEIG